MNVRLESNNVVPKAVWATLCKCSWLAAVISTFSTNSWCTTGCYMTRYTENVVVVFELCSASGVMYVYSLFEFVMVNAVHSTYTYAYHLLPLRLSPLSPSPLPPLSLRLPWLPLHSLIRLMHQSKSMQLMLLVFLSLMENSLLLWTLTSEHKYIL